MGFVQPTEGMSLVGSFLAALICQSPAAAAVASSAATRGAIIATAEAIGGSGGSGSPGVFPDADWARYAANIKTQGRRVPAALVELVSAGRASLRTRVFTH